MRLSAIVTVTALGVTLLVLSGGLVHASGVTLPNTFANDTAADANQVNANFSAIKSAVDDNDLRIGTLESVKGPVRTVLVSPAIDNPAKSGAILIKAWTDIESTLGKPCDANNRCRLQIEPGLYDLSGTPLALNQHPYVDLAGAGPEATVLINNSGTAVLTSTGKGESDPGINVVSDLGIEFLHTEGTNAAIMANATAFTLRNVAVTVTGPGTKTPMVGVWNTGASTLRLYAVRIASVYSTTLDVAIRQEAPAGGPTIDVFASSLSGYAVTHLTDLKGGTVRIATSMLSYVEAPDITSGGRSHLVHCFLDTFAPITNQ